MSPESQRFQYADRANRLRNPQVPFAEESLWRIFDCFADSLAMMEFGREFSVGGTGKTKPKTEWDPNTDESAVVHLDIKPDNSKLAAFNYILTYADLHSIPLTDEYRSFQNPGLQGR